MKMYILVKKGIPLGVQVNSVAHVALLTYFEWKEDKDYLRWAFKHFNKVTCLVTPEQFEEAKKLYEDSVVFQEEDHNDQETAMALHPKYGHTDWLQTLELFK